MPSARQHQGPTRRVVVTLLTLACAMTLRLALADADPAVNLLPPITKYGAWNFVTLAPAQTERTVEDGAAVLTVTTPGQERWRVQITRPPLDLEEGQKYTLRFRAKAKPALDLFVVGGLDQADYHTVGLAETVPLTTDWKTYTFTFTAQHLAPGHVAVPQFQIGTQTGTLWLADVSLVKGDASLPAPDTLSPPTPAPTPPATAPDRVAPGVRPRANELLLEGTVRETQPGRKQMTLLATCNVNPDGTWEAIEPPRQKIVFIGPSAPLKKLLASLKPGDRVAVVGKNIGVGKPLVARLLVKGVTL